MARWSLLLMVVVVACGSAPTADPSTPDAGDTAARIEAITAAREAVTEPAVALGSAALLLSQRTFDVVAADPDESSRVNDAVAAAADELETAAAEADDVELDTSTSDVAAAAAALEVAVDAAEQAVLRAREVVAALVIGVEADEELAGLVDQWQQPGSRRELMERFDGLAERADELADELEADAADSVCADAVEVRVTAARSVAAITRELRDLVERYRGEEFDERRAEAALDPYGLDGNTPREELVADGICLSIEVIREHTAEVTAALDDLQAALDPDDL